MADARVRMVGEDVASAVVAGVGRSVGDLTANVMIATKEVADLKKELREAVSKGQTGSIAAIGYQLDDAIPKLQQASASLRTQMKPAVDEVAGASGGWASQLTKVNGLLAGFGVGASLAGIVSFGKAIFADADALDKMSDRTAISAEGLQRLGAIAAPAGNDLGQVADAVNKFQKNIATGSAGTVEAIDEIGLTVARLRSLAPDEQFMAIAKGIQTIEDPAEQVRVAVELFGKAGAELLPTLKADVDALADSTVRMSNESVKALADAGDAWDKFWKDTKSSVGEVLGQFVLFEQEANRAFERQKELKALKDFDSGLGMRAGGDIPLPVFMPDLNIQAQIAKTNALLAQSSADLATEQSKLTAEWERGAAALAKFNQNTADVILTSQGFAAVLETVDGNVLAGVRYYQQRGVALSDLAEMYGLSKVQTAAFSQELSFEALVAKGAAGIHATLAKEVWNLDAAFEKLQGRPLTKIPALQGGINPQLAAATKTFGEGFSTMLETDLPKSIMSAIQGGGSVWKAAGSTVGSFLVSEDGFGKTITSGLTSLLGKGMGKAVSAMLPGIGALAGPLLDKLMTIGGPSKQELEGRKVEADFQKQFGSFDKMMAQVGAAYAATGRSAKQAEADVKALMDAEKQGGDAAKAMADKISGAFSEQKQDAADLAAAINEYGFSIEQLGPMMQKQQLGEQANTIMNQFRLLTNSGIDVALVEEKMGDKINAYLQQVIATGQEVPAAMKPMLEKMAEQGKLTDANGNKITDLSAAGVSFAETMTGAADRIVKGFNDVLVKIGMIPAAAEDAARKVPTNPFKDWGPPNIDFGTPPDGPPSFANEGYDLWRPTLAVVGDARNDSESILHARTVRDIVRASKNAGTSNSSGDVVRAVAAMSEAFRAEIKGLRTEIRRANELLPIAIRDAVLA